jgi:hypothetical protein
MQREEVLGLLETRLEIATGRRDRAHDAAVRAAEDHRLAQERWVEASEALVDMTAKYATEARVKAKPKAEPPAEASEKGANDGN